MCGEDGSEGTSGSGLVGHYLKNGQGDDICPKDQPLSVQERLREHSSFWEQDLEASQFVLDIITSGYKLPFITYPQPMIAKNHCSAVKHAKFVEESIGDLVHSRCAWESMSCPTVCSPLLVSGRKFIFSVYSLLAYLLLAMCLPNSLGL